MAANRRRLVHRLQAGDPLDLPASETIIPPWKDKAWQGKFESVKPSHVTLSVVELPCRLAGLLENWECVDNAWSKMTKYCELTDKSYQIYAAATFSNLT